MTDLQKIEPRTLKGFRDFSPKEQILRQSMFSKIQAVFESFGFQPMSTPALEYKEILMNKYGDEEKLVYHFKDNGDREVAMRYDLTVPLARFVAENQNQLTFPFKRYQIAPVWRAENTQRGRFREFYQCDIDTVGTESQFADAEVIACIGKALDVIGVKDYEIRINDRKLFNLFQNSFDGNIEQVVIVIRGIDKLEKIGKDGVIKYLSDQGISGKGLAQVESYLDIQGTQNMFAEIQNRFEGGNGLVKEMDSLMRRIIELGVRADRLAFDPFIARGLDYYTGVVFEVVLKDKPEFGSISGGGRYDSLVDQFSRNPLAAVGGSIGIDRLIDALMSTNPKLPTLAQVIIMNMSNTLEPEYALLAKQIREAGFVTDVYPDAVKIDKQFKYAESIGAKFGVFIGEQEKADGTVKLKNLETREEVVVKQAEIIEKLKENIK